MVQKKIFILLYLSLLLLLPWTGNHQSPAGVSPESPGEQRIVCLAYDALDMLALLGAEKMVIGRPDGSDGRRFPRAITVGSFASPDIRTIKKLQPDLVITSSDIQAKTAGELVRRHCPVLALNNYTIADITRSLRLLGRILDRQEKGVTEARNMEKQLESFRAQLPPISCRPKVHFEEYYDPCIAGGGWISEMIELAGGIDVNADRRHRRRSAERIITAEDIRQKNPDIIIAAWCGRNFDRQSILERKGWEEITAVKKGRVYTLPQELVLQPSPKIVQGIARMKNILQAVEDKREGNR